MHNFHNIHLGLWAVFLIATLVVLAKFGIREPSSFIDHCPEDSTSTVKLSHEYYAAHQSEADSLMVLGNAASLGSDSRWLTVQFKDETVAQELIQRAESYYQELYQEVIQTSVIGMGGLTVVLLLSFVARPLTMHAQESKL